MNKFANLHMFSDIEPFEVVRVVSEKTVDVRRMKAERDPNWKPTMHVNGFSVHCSNNNEQKSIIESDEEGEIVRIRLRKDGRWYSKYGRHVFSDNARHFYDFNF